MPSNLNLASAEVLPNGRTLRLKFTAPPPVQQAYPDWLPGATAGACVTLSTSLIPLECEGVIATLAEFPGPHTANPYFTNAGGTLAAGPHCCAYVIKDASGNVVGSSPPSWFRNQATGTAPLANNLGGNAQPAGYTCDFYLGDSDTTMRLYKSFTFGVQFSATSGTWNASTGVYTLASGTVSGVNPGDWLWVYQDTKTPGWACQVAYVGTNTITLNLAAQTTDSNGNRTTPASLTGNASAIIDFRNTHGYGVFIDVPPSTTAALFPAFRTLTWTAQYRIPDAQLVKLGDSPMVSGGAGLLQDSYGNATAAFSGVAVPAWTTSYTSGSVNWSLMGSDGFTDPSLSSGSTVTLYVSGTYGSNSNSYTQAQNVATPLATVSQAMGLLKNNNAAPVWATIKVLRGDTVNDPGSQIKLGGIDRLHPLTVEDYWYDYSGNGNGTGIDPGTRPTLACNGGGAFATNGGSGSLGRTDNVLLRGLNIQQTSTKATGVFGIATTLPANDFTIDDCVIQGFGENLAFQISGNVGDYTWRVTLNRCSILDSYDGLWQGIIGTTLGANYTAGSGTITCATGKGAMFGSPSVSNPIQFSMGAGKYSATGRSGDVITGLSLVSGTDTNLASGTAVADTRTVPHTQAIYVQGVADLLISQCCFDRNGWQDGGFSVANIYSHGIYIQWDCRPAVMVGSLTRKSGSAAAQFRPGGIQSYCIHNGSGNGSFISRAGGGFHRVVMEKGRDLLAPTYTVQPAGTSFVLQAGGTGSNTVQYFFPEPLGMSCEFCLAVNTNPATGANAAFAFNYATDANVVIPTLRFRNNTAANAGVGLGLGLSSSTFPAANSPQQYVYASRNVWDAGSTDVFGCGLPASGAPPNYAWLLADYNVLHTTATGTGQAQITTAATGQTGVSLAAYGSTTGTETHSVTPAPSYAYGATPPDLGTYGATLGLGLDGTEQAFVNLLRGRQRKVWGSAYDIANAVNYYLAQYRPTNLSAIDASPNGFYGAGPAWSAFGGPGGGGGGTPLHGYLSLNVPGHGTLILQF